MGQQAGADPPFSLPIQACWGPVSCSSPVPLTPRALRRRPGRWLQEDCVPRASTQDPMTDTQQVLNKYLLRGTWKRGRMGRGGMQAAR